MLNLQATGGISFKKGCYTGQEIIARMQFRGSLKRSMYRAVLENPVTPVSGASVFSDNKASAAGIVVSAVNDDNKIHLLIVLENDKTQQTLSLTPNGQDIITLTALRYSLDPE
jgi:folate-binding Fe-S cluster repair protein YgfZ